MANHVGDTWLAWQGPMHVGHMACHVSSCMALLNPINRGFQFSLWESSISVRGGSSKEKEEEGKREREERKRERKEEREEERGGREEKERGKGRSVAQ